MILLTTRFTKKKLEKYLDISKKKADAAFEDLDRLEVKVGVSRKRHPNPV